MKIFCSQNKIYMKENNWSKVAAGAAMSQSGRILGRIQGRDEIIFFFKNQQQSGQELARFAAGFGPFTFCKNFSSFPCLKAVFLHSSNNDLYKRKTLLLSGCHILHQQQTSYVAYSQDLINQYIDLVETLEALIIAVILWPFDITLFLDHCVIDSQRCS